MEANVVYFYSGLHVYNLCVERPFMMELLWVKGEIWPVLNSSVFASGLRTIGRENSLCLFLYQGQPPKCTRKSTQIDSGTLSGMRAETSP